MHEEGANRYSASPAETMNRSACYGTPKRKAATRRFCSTPIGPGYPPDNEAGPEEDIHSFMSSMDEFIEKFSMLEAPPSPLHTVAPRGNTSSYGQPVEDADPLFPQQCLQTDEEEEEDTFCVYEDVPPPEHPCTWSNAEPYCSSRVTSSGHRGNTLGERNSYCVQNVESQQASGNFSLRGVHCGPDPIDTGQAPLEDVTVEAQNRCFCSNPALCRGGLRCFAPRERFDVGSTSSPRCAQGPEPGGVPHGYHAQSPHRSRRLDVCTLEGYDRVPGEPLPDVYMETYNAYCEMEDRPAASRGHLYHRSSASERHSASYNASVDMEDVICIDDDEDDPQQYSRPEYDLRLFPNSRRPRLDTVANVQKENNSATNCQASVASSSRSCREPSNLSKELNGPEAEASDWDVPRAANHNLTSKEASTEHPIVAVSSAESIQSKQFSHAPVPTLAPKDEDGSFDASVVMEDVVLTPESCIGECKSKEASTARSTQTKQFSPASHSASPPKDKDDSYNPSVTTEDVSTPEICIHECKRPNYGPSCNKDSASIPNKCPEENHKLGADSRPFCKSRCSRQDIVAAALNEKEMQHSFSSSVARSLNSHKELNDPEIEPSNIKTSNQSLTSKKATSERTVLVANSSARTERQQSSPGCDLALPSKDENKPHLHQAVDNDRSACSGGTVKPGPASRGYSPLFFTDITNTVAVPHTTDSKPTCHSPAVNFSDSAARGNSTGRPRVLVSSFVYPDDIDESIIISSTPSEDEIELDDADVYKELDIDDVPGDSPAPNSPVCKLGRTSRTAEAHSDELAEGSEELDTTLVAPADAATNRACESNTPVSSPSSVTSADVLDIHLCAEDRTFTSEVQPSPFLSELTTSTVSGDLNSSVVHAKSTPTPASELQCPAVLPEDPASTSAQVSNLLDEYKKGSSLQSLQGDPEIFTTDLPEEGEVLNSPSPTNSPIAIRDSTPSFRHSPARTFLKSEDQASSLVRATLMKNSKTQSSAKLAVYPEVHMTDFLDEYKQGRGLESLQGDPEALALDLLEEGEVLSSPSPANSPIANHDPTPSLVPSSPSHSGKNSPARRFPKLVHQPPNLLRAALVKNLKKQKSSKLAAHSQVNVINFLDEYEGGSSSGSLQDDSEVLTIDFVEDEISSSPTNTSGSEDLRAKINAVRGLPECQLEDKLSRGQNAADVYPPLGHSTTINALCLEARQSAISSEAPELKVRIPFLSEDPAENLDNHNPAWEALRQLTTEEERYQHVHKVWRSTHIPDPHQELTTFHYRRRVAGLRPRADTLAVKRGKRRAPHEPSPSEGVGPSKRQRFDTDIFDLKLKELERKKARDFTEAKDNLRRNLDRLHRDIRRNEERQASSHQHRHYHHDGRPQRHHHRAETAPSDYHYWRMQERQIRDEFVANAQCINNKFYVKERQLLTARDEVHQFDAFYVGLHEDFDPRHLSESQLKQQLEAEKALGLFKLYYSPAQD